ncbi:hypothetical protein [Ereboglobus luteus]|uniref:Uncharacterized protein n=1 Tax=Ereboglobus luteus TaxID=1796921 RepID=A0A2U8DZS8_9BACT|nr:hypothetical protein [Ereboglobus luteus]AWI08096.1 hypothetical protein CKA38_01405 [Ereboglobus luteus]
MSFYRLCKCFLGALSLLLAGFCAASGAADKAGAQDLGEGLVYFRMTNPAADLPALKSVLAENKAAVVDLRGVDARVADVRALRIALVPPVSPETRAARFVLINRDTSSAVPFTLNAGLPDNTQGVLVMALAVDNVPADVKVRGSVEDDRRACEAISKGAAVSTLINHQPDKKRYDEAALMRDYQGLPEPEVEAKTVADKKAPDAADSDSQAKPGEKETEGESSSPESQPPPTDSLLQAAVQTHRALLALGKL